MDWTSTKLANRVARLFALDDEGKTRLHRAFRNQVEKGVLPTVLNEDDGRGTKTFGDDIASGAVLLLVMADMAIDARGLRDAADDIFGRDRPDRRAAKTVRIAEAIKAVKAGKDFDLVTVLTWHETTAKVTRTTKFDLPLPAPKDEAEAQAQEIIENFKLATNVELATLRVPASQLLRVFLSNEEV